MGVVGLWQILSEVGELRSLSEEGGTTLAVDLSTWIYQARNASIQKKSSPFYFMIRTIFYRTVELLRCGVKLVFVLDGVAPELKLKTLQKRQDVQESRSPRAGPSLGSTSTDRHWLKDEVKEVVRLLECLGLPVVQSPGEAEKMCAYLNSTQVVDAVLTNDSDAFLYGAKKIYRNYKFEEKTAVSVCMNDIEEDLQLDRRSLIAFALLSGCDYNERGVKGIGPDNIQVLFDEVKQHNNDILDRICGWECDKHLQKLHKMKAELTGVEKSSHCSRCKHTGTVTVHRTKGCDTCKTDSLCSEDSDVVCGCAWHSIKQEISPYCRELKAREKALEMKNFTQHCKQIVEEFTSATSEKNMAAGQCFKGKQPNLGALCQFLSRTLHMDKAKVVATLMPVLAHMQMKKEFNWPEFQPISIEKTCKRNYVKCYQTLWSKLAEDNWTTDDTYTIDVERELFGNVYEEIVAKFQETSVKKTKVSTPHNQRRIHDMFSSPASVRKKHEGPPGPRDTPSPSSGGGSQGQLTSSCKKKLDFSGAKTESAASPTPKTKNNKVKSKKCEQLQTSENDEEMPDMKTESGVEVLSEKQIDSSPSLSSQGVKSSDSTDVHSFASEDLFPSDEEDDSDTSAKVAVETCENQSGISVGDSADEENDVMIIDKTGNEDLKTDQESVDSDICAAQSTPDPVPTASSGINSQTSSSRLRTNDLMPVGLGDSDEDSSPSDDVLLIDSGESNSSLPSLNSSSSSDVIVLDCDVMDSTSMKAAPSVTVQKRKGLKSFEKPVKKAKSTNQKRGSNTKSIVDNKQKSLRSYFPVRK